MNDWIGITFFVLLLVGAFFGLRALAKPRKSTSDEFERNAAESASLTNASMNALNEMLNPGAAKSKEVQMQMKQGTFSKSKREGKSEGNNDDILEAEIIE